MICIDKKFSIARSGKGSATVEAAVALPIFVLVIFTFAFLIKIVYVQERIQYALTESSNEFATYSYLYKKTGLLDASSEIKKAGETFGENVEGIRSSANGILSNFESITLNVKNAFSDISVAVAKFRNIENIKDIFSVGNDFIGSISQIIEKMGTYKNDITDDLSGIKDNLGQGLDIMNDIIKNPGQIYDAAKSEVIRTAETYAGNYIIKALMRKYISPGEYLDFRVIGGEDGIDLGRSAYFEYDNLLKTDSVIDIIATYSIKLPISLPGIDRMNFVQRVTVRAWTGASETDTKETNNDNSSPAGNEDGVAGGGGGGGGF